MRRVALTLAAFAAVAFWAQAGSAAKPCWQTLVDDWSDGAISNLYPIHCYRQALQSMPEDVRLYSSAGDDINRALAGRSVGRSIAASAARPAAKPVAAAAVTGDGGSSGAPFVLSGMLAAMLVLGFWGGYLAKRKRRGAARLDGPHG